MPFLLSLLGGGAVTYFLIESELAIPAFIVYVIWLVLLFVWPAGAFYFIGAVIALGLLGLAIVFWEWVLGIAIGFGLFILTVVGLLHAVEVMAK